ncbi:MAG TPA: flagellar hook-basal body protein [Bacilli bacterium]
MNTSMITALSAMQAFQQKLDMIAGNVANADTDGYKRKASPFESLLASEMRQPNPYMLAGRKTPLGLPIEWGVKNGEIRLDLTQGALRETGNPLDLALEGNALFEVETNQLDENGLPRRAWTRNGAFRMTPMEFDPDSMQLTTADGYVVMGIDDAPIIAPRGYSITVSPQGEVIATSKDGSDVVDIRAIKIMTIVGPHLLVDVGDNLYGVKGGDVAAALQPTDFALLDAQTEPIAVRQGFLEASNVDIAAEMTDLLQVQRAFQLGSRALSSADTMMNLANNLRA